MDEKKIFPLFHKTINSLSDTYNDTVEEEMKKSGLTGADFYRGILPAKHFDPDPISAQALGIRGPYAAAPYYDKILKSLKENDIFDYAQEGGYILSRQGHMIFRRIIGEIYRLMDTAPLLKVPEMEELKILLARIVQASLLSDAQPRKWAILHSRRMDPGQNVPPIVSIDQYLSDLLAYRDDVHLQSWIHLDVSAHTWEMFSFIWKGEVKTLEALLIKMEYRMFPNKETLIAINDLIRKGWIEKGDKPALTEKGREIREAAEELTDQYFYAPWEVLTKQEKTKLGNLLTQLSQGLEKK